MAQTITIKQSTSTDAPTTLTNAELAYSASSNKLWIGRPGGTTSNVDAIGGKYFTDRSIESGGLSFDTATGVLTINQVGTNLDETVDLDGRYIRDKATTTALGGIKIYSGTVQSVSAQPAGTTALRTYGIQLNSADQAVVNVPWTNTEYTAGTGLTLSGTTFNANVDGINSTAAETSTTTADRTYKVQVDSGDNLVVNVPWAGVGNFTFTDDEISSSGSTMTLDPHDDGITGKVVINGDLEVKGVTTTIESTTVTIADNYIQLNSAQDENSAPPTTMFCGIQVDRGNETYDSGIYWVESSDEWVVNTGGAGINRLIHDSNFEAKYPVLNGGTF